MLPLLCEKTYLQLMTRPSEDTKRPAHLEPQWTLGSLPRSLKQGLLPPLSGTGVRCVPEFSVQRGKEYHVLYSFVYMHYWSRQGLHF